MSLNIRYELKSHDMTASDYRNGTHQLKSPPHLHRDLELVCMLDGTTEAFADTVRYELHPGDVFLTFPNQIHSYKSFGEERYLIFIFKPDLLPEFAEIFRTVTPESAILRGAFLDPNVRRLAEQLLRGKKDGEDERVFAAMRRGYLLAFFSELLAYMNLQSATRTDSDAMRSIVAFCTSNFTEDLSLSLLEEKLHLNKYYISHLLSGKLGMRFNDYINSIRVSEACRYLRYSDHSITEISELVGFNTLRTFNRAFSKQLGLTPSEFRALDLVK